MLHCQDFELRLQYSVQVILKEPKPLSSFSNEEGLELLLGPKHSEAKNVSFPMADLHTEDKVNEIVRHAMDLATVGDVLRHLGADLAMRCLHGEPRSYTKEYAGREVISPLLYAASILSGIQCHMNWAYTVPYELGLAVDSGCRYHLQCNLLSHVCTSSA